MNRDRARLRAQVRPDPHWYNISNHAGVGGPAEVTIYDEVGYWGVTAEECLAELRSITATEITLRVNSPGGEIFDGIAIFNCLRSHPANVTTYVDSLAASIASVIALAGDTVIMQPYSQMMIHDGSGLCIGQASDMREMADLLDRLSDNIASVYADRAGGSIADWRALMLAETWLSADEAVEAGLADEVARTPRQAAPANDPALAASWDLSVFFKYPGRDAAPPPRIPRAAAHAVEPEPAPAVPAPVEVPAAPVDAPAVEPSVEESAEESAEELDDQPDEPTELQLGEPDPQEPEDEWTSIAARLTNPTSSGVDDEFARLTEALL